MSLRTRPRAVADVSVAVYLAVARIEVAKGVHVGGVDVTTVGDRERTRLEEEEDGERERERRLQPGMVVPNKTQTRNRGNRRVVVLQRSFQQPNSESSQCSNHESILYRLIAEYVKMHRVLASSTRPTRVLKGQGETTCHSN